MTDDTRIKSAGSEKDIAEPFADERLFHEINLLRLEGYYFCLDPKEAARRRGKREFEETLKMRADAIEKRPVVISINPDYGQPSTTAYKILQAIIKKLSDYGLPASDTVYFSQRELARMVGRKSFGGNGQKQFLHAFRQLRDTKILCWFYEKETDTWKMADFQILDGALFSRKADRITQCFVEINNFIVKSLNSRYTACLNYSRMQELEPIGAALYKHLFYHFSNIYSTKKRKEFFYNKDYADICTTWLGGLKVLRFRSKIVKEQLGRHLDALKQIKLIKNYSLEQNAKGDGFTLCFYPGSGFFDDYLHFYEKQLQFSMPFRKAADDQHEEPLLLVHYFYSKLYPTQTGMQTICSDKETDLAQSLLQTYTKQEIKDLIDYTVEEAQRTQFMIRTFGGVRGFVKPWLAEREARAAKRARAAAEEAEAREIFLRERYEAFKTRSIEQFKAALPPEELNALETQLRERLQNDNGPAYMADMVVRAQLDTAIAERFSLLSFNDWKEQARG